jgi:hypothetical protein
MAMPADIFTVIVPCSEHDLPLKARLDVPAMQIRKSSLIACHSRPPRLDQHARRSKGQGRDPSAARTMSLREFRLLLQADGLDEPAASLHRQCSLT